MKEETPMIEFAHLQSFVLVLLAICSVIAAIAGAAAAVTKYWRFAHKQSDKNTEDIEEFREYLRSDKTRIERLEQNQAEFREQNKLMLAALKTLLSHEIDGNHTVQLKEKHDAIDKYLIEHLGGDL